MPTHTLTIPRWHPTRLNEVIGRHWRSVHKRKAADYEMVAAYALSEGVPRALGKRRVRARLVMGPRMRRPDPDSVWKVLLDSLVSAGLLVDDGPRWCEVMPLEYGRGAERATVITLEDLT